MSATRYARQARFAFAPPPPADPLPNRCAEADRFYGVCVSMLDKVRQAPDELAINVALLQLQHQYFLRYEIAPKGHKDHIGTRNGHCCLHQVWRYFYGQLRELLLAVNPPPMRPPAPPPAPPQIDGIFLGDDLEP
jgi:hypothetical protein